MSETVFSKIIRKEIPAEIIYEDDHVIAFLDIFPVNLGHTLFVPKEESENMMSLSEESFAKILSAVKKVAPAILESVGAVDFNFDTNVGPVAGQVIMQTHFHFIPRFEDDGLKKWGHREVSSEELKELCEKIKVSVGSL